METINITEPPRIQNPRLAEIHREADAVQLFLNEESNIQDPASLTGRLQAMDVYMARISELVSLSRAMKEYALNLYLEENEDKLAKLSATVSNRMIKSFLYEFNVTVDRLDTMYSAMVHLSRNLVTQISFIKQQMQSLHYQ